MRKCAARAAPQKMMKMKKADAPAMPPSYALEAQECNDLMVERRRESKECEEDDEMISLSSSIKADSSISSEYQMLLSS